MLNNRIQILLVCAIFCGHAIYRLFYTTEDRFGLLFNSSYTLVCFVIAGLLLFYQRRLDWLYYGFSALVVIGWLLVFWLGESIRTEGVLLAAVSAWLTWLVNQRSRTIAS